MGRGKGQRPCPLPTLKLFLFPPPQHLLYITRAFAFATRKRKRAVRDKGGAWGGERATALSPPHILPGIWYSKAAGDGQGLGVAACHGEGVCGVEGDMVGLDFEELCNEDCHLFLAGVSEAAH